MKTGTKYCPNHPGAKHLEFSDECSQCNEPLLRFGEDKELVITWNTSDAEGAFPSTYCPPLDSIVVEPLAEPIEEKEIVLRRLAGMWVEPEPEKTSFKALHETVTTKIQEKVEPKKATPHSEISKGYTRAKKGA